MRVRNESVSLIESKYHKEILRWQKRNFPDIDLLEKHWDKYFPNEQKYALCVRTAPLENDLILQGKYKGQRKFAKASSMKGSMLYQALRIIKAQCSTELGSIQQHGTTVDASYSDYAKFSVLRIMAEELRHAYQMFWVLSHDSSWSATGEKRIADNIMDELLQMETGSHVLDAFNIEFTDALDNICFACFVDRIGKFQLSMQEEFAYEPMSMSMKPMLREEAFHLKTGWEVLREICEAAAIGECQWTLDDVQRKINVWFPRALEMFGSEEGGESNLQFSFKSTSNRDAIQEYVREVEWLMGALNAAILKAREPGLSKIEIRAKIKQHSFLGLPSTRFMRIRSGDSLVQSTFDIEGNKLTPEAYESYLLQVLPEKFTGTKFYQDYINKFKVEAGIAA